MAEFKIPGGDDKDTLLADAAEKSIRYWLGRREKELTDNPEGEWSDRNATWIKAAKAELARRAGGGAQSAPRQPAQQQRQPAPSRALARQQPSDLQSLGAAMHDPAAVTAKLQELSASYHMVGPATKVDGMPPGCGVAISFVTVNPDDSKDGPGEVYGVGNKLGLSGATLSKLGAAAGVSWDARQSGRLDDGSDPLYCHFRAVGQVRNFDGSMRVLTGEVEIDAREGSPQIDEIRKKAEARKRENPTWKNDGGDSQILELRKFLLRHAERKAKNRAIADMGIKRSYTKAELQKPFAVARLMWTGQSEDPELRRIFAGKTADAMLGGMTALYGKPPQQPPPAAHDEPELPPFQGHAPPAISGRAAHDTTGDDAPDSEPYAAPTEEEMRQSDERY